MATSYTVLSKYKSTYGSPYAYYTLTVTPATSRTGTTCSFTYSASAYLQYSTSSNNYRLTMSISTDGGSTWTALGYWSSLSGTTSKSITKSVSSFTMSNLADTQTSATAYIYVKVTCATSTYSALNSTRSVNAVTIPARTVTLSYNLNGGTPSISSVSRLANATTTISATTPTRSGYTFLGWASNATSPSIIQPSGTISNIGTCVLSAQWRANVTDPTYRSAPIFGDITDVKILPKTDSEIGNVVESITGIAGPNTLIDIYHTWDDVPTASKLWIVYQTGDLDPDDKTIYTDDNLYAENIHENSYTEVDGEDLSTEGTYILRIGSSNIDGLWSFSYALCDIEYNDLYDVNGNELYGG